PAPARAQGPGPALRPDRQRHPQPAPDRPPAAHQQGAGAPDPEPGPGKAARLRRTRRLGAQPPARLALCRPLAARAGYDGGRSSPERGAPGFFLVPAAVKSYHLTVSIGVATAGPGERRTAAELLREAEENVTRAKVAGRNRVVG